MSNFINLNDLKATTTEPDKFEEFVIKPLGDKVVKMRKLKLSDYYAVRKMMPDFVKKGEPEQISTLLELFFSACDANCRPLFDNAEDAVAICRNMPFEVYSALIRAKNLANVDLEPEKLAQQKEIDRAKNSASPASSESTP